MKIDLEKIKLTQDFAAEVATKKELISIPVRKPDKQWFIQVHPDPEYQIRTAVLELKEDRETYLVDNSLWEELQSEIAFKLLLTAINKQGNLFIWPIRLPGMDGKIDEWNRSALEISELAKKSWCRVMSNMNIGAYEVLRAESLELSPTWPDKTIDEIVQIAFKGKYVDSIDHAVIKRLRGEV